MTCDLFTSLQAREEDYWVTSSSGIPLSELSKSTPIVAQYCGPDAMMAGSQDCGCMSRTFDCSIHPSTRDAWISSQAASLAKIFPSLAKVPGSRASDQDYGKNLPGLLAKYDPATHSLKTAQCSLIEDSTSCLAILPRWGSMRNGRLYQQPKLVLPIAGNASGSWPTPDASMGTGGRVSKAPPLGLRPSGSKKSITLNDAVKWANVLQWPTPTVCDNYNRKGASTTSGNGLATAVNLFPTPTTRDHKGGANWANRQRNGKPRPRGDMTLPDVVEAWGGSINPVWVCWIQGFPLNWFQAGGTASPMSDE